LKWHNFKAKRSDIVVRFLRAKKKKALAETVLKQLFLHQIILKWLENFREYKEHRQWELRTFWVTLKLAMKFKRMITRRGGSEGFPRKLRNYLRYGFSFAGLTARSQ
jgi:hypothetical protein